MNPGTSIFEFSDYREFLRHCQLKHPKRQRRALSLEEWAKRLGYKSPRSIGMLLNGQRFPNETQLRGLTKDLGLGLREAQYFRLLVERERLVSKVKSTLEVDLKIKFLLEQVKNVIHMDHEHFSYIANWYFLPLRKWLELNSGAADLKDVAHAFRGKLQVSEIERAFEIMNKLGLIELQKESALPKSKNQARIKTTLDRPSHAIRLHHIQMMQRATDAIGEIPVSDREFNAWTFRMNPSHMEQLKTKIREWGENLTNQVPDGEGEIFQLSVQCFPHTQKL